MENNMEATKMLGVIKGLFRDNGKWKLLLHTSTAPWGTIRVILGLYGDNGKEHGNYYDELYMV